MNEPILYTIGGIILTLTVFGALVWLDRKETDSAKKTKNTASKVAPVSWFKLSCMLLIAVFGLIVTMFVSIYETWKMYDDWSEYQLMHDQGVRQVVPLIRRDTISPGRKVNYLAVYEFNGESRKEYVSESLYDSLSGQGTVEILVYGDKTLIANNKPEVFWLLCLIPFASFVLIGGGYGMGLMVHDRVRIVRQKIKRS